MLAGAPPCSTGGKLPGMTRGLHPSVVARRQTQALRPEQFQGIGMRVRAHNGSPAAPPQAHVLAGAAGGLVVVGVQVAVPGLVLLHLVPRRQLAPLVAVGVLALRPVLLDDDRQHRQRGHGGRRRSSGSGPSGAADPAAAAGPPLLLALQRTSLSAGQESTRLPCDRVVPATLPGATGLAPGNAMG